MHGKRFEEDCSPAPRLPPIQPGVQTQFRRAGEQKALGRQPQPVPYDPADAAADFLPFQEGTVLLSYGDDLAIVITGRGIHIREV